VGGAGNGSMYIRTKEQIVVFSWEILQIKKDPTVNRYKIVFVYHDKKETPIFQ
jgi:hypothetical protein